jgi:hypothetical protein
MFNVRCCGLLNRGAKAWLHVAKSSTINAIDRNMVVSRGGKTETAWKRDDAQQSVTISLSFEEK